MGSFNNLSNNYYYFHDLKKLGLSYFIKNMSTPLTDIKLIHGSLVCVDKVLLVMVTGNNVITPHAMIISAIKDFNFYFSQQSHSKYLCQHQ